MDKRSFLKTMTAIGAVGVSGASSAKSGYDPAARMAVKVSEVEYRRTAKGRPLLARIYQPQGKGPFPIVLDLHGGAWSGKDRYANEPMSRAAAAGGADGRRERGLCRGALADQRPVGALPAGAEDEAREPDQGEPRLVRAVGDDPRGEPAGDAGAQGGGYAAADAHHAGRARRQRA